MVPSQALSWNSLPTGEPRANTLSLSLGADVFPADWFVQPVRWMSAGRAKVCLAIPAATLWDLILHGRQLLGAPGVLARVQRRGRRTNGEVPLTTGTVWVYALAGDIH